MPIFYGSSTVGGNLLPVEFGIRAGTLFAQIDVGLAEWARDAILKIDATYHGGADLFEFGPSSDDLSRPVPYTGGVPANLAGNVVLAHWKDTEGITRAIDDNAARLAAVIMTPVASIGWSEPVSGILEAVRAATATRMASCLNQDAYARLDELGERLRAGLRDSIAVTRAPFRVSGVGSIAGLESTLTGSLAADASVMSGTLRIAYLNHGLHAKIFVTSTVMTEADVDECVSKVHDALAELVSEVPTVVGLGKGGRESEGKVSGHKRERSHRRPSGRCLNPR